VEISAGTSARVITLHFAARQPDATRPPGRHPTSKKYGPDDRPFRNPETPSDAKTGIDRPRTPRTCGYGGHSRQLWAYFLTPRVYAGALHRVTELVGTNRPLATVDDTEILRPSPHGGTAARR
jgi:hypothetical protein